MAWSSPILQETRGPTKIIELQLDNRKKAMIQPQTFPREPKRWLATIRPISTSPFRESAGVDRRNIAFRSRYSTVTKSVLKKRARGRLT